MERKPSGNVHLVTSTILPLMARMLRLTMGALMRTIMSLHRMRRNNCAQMHRTKPCTDVHSYVSAPHAPEYLRINAHHQGRSLNANHEAACFIGKTGEKVEIAAHCLKVGGKQCLVMELTAFPYYSVRRSLFQFLPK